MKVDRVLGSNLHKAGTRAREAEEAGYSGIWTAETSHDPFLPLALAAEHTERLELGTEIAVAFARTPMLLANIGWDLQGFSGGRVILGLGSQIEAHITKRYSMPWSRPAARMRELVQATRAIWDCGLHETPLDFRGDFYTHTLMTPMFMPNPAPLRACGPPRVFIAGVGERMTEVAGEVADGFLCHGFSTPQYLREVTLPALARGRARAGHTLEGFEVAGPSFVVTATTEEGLDAAICSAREQLAFYGSTPAYRGVLELHGWGDLQGELHVLSKQGRWREMGDLIDDEVLHTIAVVGEPEAVAAELVARYGGLVDRITLFVPGDLGAHRTRSVLETLAGEPGRG